MLHSETHGSAAKPTLCFLHGFMGSKTDWTPIVDAMAPSAWCLAVDLPGHGRSTERPRHEYTMEGATQALADVLDDAGVEACTLVGYSMGGRLALYFTKHHGDRVRRLVVESATPGLAVESDRLRRRRIDANRAAAIEEDFDAFLAEWYRQPLFASLAQHDLVETMVETRRANDPHEVARALRGLSTGRQPSLWPHLPAIEVPMLALTGALDEKYAGITAEMVERNPSIRRVVVPDAGHNVHAERPDAFVQHLQDFLADAA
jgi:2-succinyl-6-hydroxy-2,4-cyclohexadiene-1-carboxylate synthase